MTPSQPSRPLQVRPTDPYIRWMVPDVDRPALAWSGDCVAWLGRGGSPEEVWATALGDSPATVAGLVVELASAHAVDGVTVPDAAFEHLPAHLRSPDAGHWCLWVRDTAGVPQEPTGAIDLASDDPRIDPLLAHSTSAHLFAGNPAVVRWVGIVDGDDLLAVAGLVREKSGAAHIVSVCTHPDHRGRGLAGRVCGALMQGAVADRAPVIVLEMYAWNEAGRRAYQRLGFVEAGVYRSGLLRRS